VRKAFLGIEAYKANGIQGWYFGTLTMNKRWRGAASVTNFRKNWNKFYQRMKRKTDGSLYYILLPEPHKDGSLHVHIISTCQAGSRWWKDTGAKCGMGFQNQNEPLRSTAKAAWYVTKYVGKSIENTKWPDDLRRVRFSVRWPQPVQDENFAWNCVPPDLAKHYVRKRLAMGYKLTNAITGEIVNVKAHPIKSSTRLLSNLDLGEKGKQVQTGIGSSET